jgi:hypothetical protein
MATYVKPIHNNQSSVDCWCGGILCVKEQASEQLLQYTGHIFCPKPLSLYSLIGDFESFKIYANGLISGPISYCDDMCLWQSSKSLYYMSFLEQKNMIKVELNQNNYSM